MTWKCNSSGGRALRDGETRRSGDKAALRDTDAGAKGIRLTAESLLSQIRISHADRSCD